MHLPARGTANLAGIAFRLQRGPTRTATLQLLRSRPCLSEKQPSALSVVSTSGLGASGSAFYHGSQHPYFGRKPLAACTQTPGMIRPQYLCTRHTVHHNALRLFSTSTCLHSQRADSSRQDTEPRPDHDKPRTESAASALTQKLSETKEKTKDLTAKVKSSLTNLTPHENIYNIPNLLTASRLVAAPVIGYLIVNGDLKWALGLFFYASVTDLIDGWMARRFKLQTVVGSVIDPMADKLLMTVMTISLAVKGLLPAYLATLILGRDVALAVAAIYYRYASLPAPKTMKRYWDFSLPSAEVHPTTVSKYNTFLQLVLIGATLALPVVAAEPYLTQSLHDAGLFMPTVESSITYFQYLVAATTAWSGLSYAVLKNAVRILGNDEALKAKQGRTGRRIIGSLFGSIVLASLILALRDEQPETKESDVDAQS